MADTFNTEQRSQIMRSVKSIRNKSTEQKLISFFKENNINGWRRSFKLFGKPDIVFPSFRIAIFTDGCFWHGHDCRNTKPKTNESYWKAKIEKNKTRDQSVSKVLQEKGWEVIRIWECSLKDTSKLVSIQNKLQQCITSRQSGNSGITRYLTFTEPVNIDQIEK
ncbi:MAG: very short patch repair endonuclease [Bacteroidales bacterium]|nr:very short patch repair endonuclease [Bacteroidales bacterium]